MGFFTGINIGFTFIGIVLLCTTLSLLLALAIREGIKRFFLYEYEPLPIWVDIALSLISSGFILGIGHWCAPSPWGWEVVTASPATGWRVWLGHLWSIAILVGLLNMIVITFLNGAIRLAIDWLSIRFFD